MCVPVVGLLGACGTTTRPEVIGVSVEERPHWLHDMVTVEFSESVEPQSWYFGVHVETSNGSPVPIQTLWSPLTDEFKFFVDEDVALSGTLRIVFDDGINDHDGDPLVPAIVDWELEEWFREDLTGSTDSLVGAPTLVTGFEEWAGAVPRPVVLWTDGAEGERHLTGVTRDDQIWAPLGEVAGFSDDPVMGCAGRWSLMVLWRSVGYVNWTQEWSDPRALDSIEPSSITCSDEDTAVAGSSSATSLSVALDSDDWALTGGGSIAITELVGEPVVALSGSSLPAVAFLDRLPSGVHLRVLVFGGAVWSEMRREPVIGATTVAQLEIVGDTAYVAWTEANDSQAHVRVARISATRWSLLPDVSPDAERTSAPSLTITEEASPMLTWLEETDGTVTGRTAVWRDDEWEDLGSPWTDGGVSVDGASASLHAGVHPMATWREDGRVRIALYNGPAAE
jgi:hypothetical protein